MEYFAHSNEGTDMMHGMEYGMWGWVVMLLVVFLMIAAIVWLVRALNNSSSSTKDQDPLDILKGRYAKGDITKQQFDQAKKDLS